MLWYKVTYLNIPLVPHAKQSYFAVSAEIDLKGEGQPAYISMALPSSQKGLRIVSQESEAGDFGYTIAQTEEGERGEWTKRRVDGKAKIFYKITLVHEAFDMRSIDETPEEQQDSIVLPEAGMANAMQLWDVITSYSIHYTKLYEYLCCLYYRWCSLWAERILSPITSTGRCYIIIRVV